MLASKGVLVYKIPDAGWSNPFDIMVYSNADAYVCPVFDEKRYYLIPIQTFVGAFSDSKRSLSEDECRKLSSKDGVA